VNSLRFRLTLGFALVAIVPLGLSLLLWTRRIQETVHADAAARLATSLREIEYQVRRNGESIERKLSLLARDPQLRRLYLLGAASRGELNEYLASQQALMGLDYLWIENEAGEVEADGMSAPISPFHAQRHLRDALDRTGVVGLRITRVTVPAERDSASWLALDVRRPIRYQSESAGVVRGGDVLGMDDLLQLGKPRDLRLAGFDAAGRPSGLNFASAVPIRRPAGAGPTPLKLAGEPFVGRAITLPIGTAPHASIAGFLPTTGAEATIASLRTSAALLGLLGVAVAVALGFLWSRQVSRPVERLASFSKRISRGEWDEPLRMESVRELQALVTALERMRGDLRDYRDRLAAGERQAAYGQMARKVAHEIKNPLTPIAISVADLKRSFDQQRPDFPQILDQAVRTIGEEVQTLKRLLQEFSEFGRFPAPQFAPVDVSELLADLGTLFGHEVATGRLVLDARTDLGTVTADRAQLRQALLNLIQNGLDAAGEAGHVRIGAAAGDALEISVTDDGPGLTAEQRAQLFVPGFTTKAHGSGLGLTIVERIVSDHRGSLAVESTPGRGTTFRIRLPLGRGA